jgi:hypothetical protein
MPFSVAYPVFAYVIENTVGRYQDKNDAARVLRKMFSAVLTASDLFMELAQRTSSTGHIPVLSAVPESGITISPENTEAVLGYYGTWIGKVCREQLWINDPYMTPEELEPVLRIVLERNSALEISVITCRATLERERVSQPYRDAFRDVWSRASINRPPLTRVIVASLEPGGKSLVHDRWWISKADGLVFGTSLNAVAGARISRVDPMSPALFSAAVRELMPIVTMRKREQGGALISYESFDLI